MAKRVHCVVLKQEAEALERAPVPGELGERILANVSREGWRRWLERLTIIINENNVSTADARVYPMIEEVMEDFFFGAGADTPPPGFKPAGRKK